MCYPQHCTPAIKKVREKKNLFFVYFHIKKPHWKKLSEVVIMFLYLTLSSFLWSKGGIRTAHLYVIFGVTSFCYCSYSMFSCDTSFFERKIFSSRDDSSTYSLSWQQKASTLPLSRPLCFSIASWMVIMALVLIENQMMLKQLEMNWSNIDSQMFLLSLKHKMFFLKLHGTKGLLTMKK